MKKPTKEEWMKHHTEMHILAKQAARLNRYTFDPKTKLEFVKPKSLERSIAMLHTTNEQLTLDLQPKREVIWRVQIGRYTKGAYKTRCSMTNANQAIRYYHCINIGRGYKKRLVKLEGGKAVTIAKQTS